MKNIFIEGMQGTGKTTLLKHLSQRMEARGYCAYEEGKISPVELAWCSYMTQEQYQAALEKFPGLREEISKHSEKEEAYRIVEYTKIRTEHRVFYEYMEQYEIYNGRKSFEEFREIVYRRFAAFHGTGNLFECSFFQNIVEELMLYQLLSEEEILIFYRELFERIDQENFLMLYLYSEEIEVNTEQAKRERVDENGREIWFELMLQYLNESPYGRLHPFCTVSDVAAHFRRRLEIEQMLIRELLREQCIVIPAKQYDMNELERRINSRL